MTQVVIAGIGQTPVGEHWEISLRELSLQAIEAAVLDAGGIAPQFLVAGNMLAPQLSRQAHLGALIADFAGLSGIEALTVESAGSSGGVALRTGYLAVASGQVNAALILGVEKFTDQIGSSMDGALTSASDSDFEAVQGMTPTAQAALIMQRYLYEFKVSRESFAGFAVTAHANGAGNRNAMFRKAISLSTYNRAGSVSEPLNMFDVAPNADGAAALILTRSDLLPPSYPHPLVRIAASSQVTDTLALHDRPDPLTFQAAHLSSERAYTQARITPRDIDLFELHDAFSIYAALSLEACGFAERGYGWQPAEDGRIALDGEIPISTMGGLKARGNPGGATGVYQAVEACIQLRGQAGQNQVANARRALIQCLGGPASSAATHVLERID